MRDTVMHEGNENYFGCLPKFGIFSFNFAQSGRRKPYLQSISFSFNGTCCTKPIMFIWANFHTGIQFMNLLEALWALNSTEGPLGLMPLSFTPFSRSSILKPAGRNIVRSFGEIQLTIFGKYSQGSYYIFTLIVIQKSFYYQ